MTQGAALHSQTGHMHSHTQIQYILHTQLHSYDFTAQNLHTIHNNPPSHNPTQHGITIEISISGKMFENSVI